MKMKKVIISCILFNLLFIGTVFAAPQKAKENVGGGTFQIGIISEERIMAESKQVKASQEEFNRQGQEIVKQLEEEKEKLTAEEFTKKQQELYGKFMTVKQQMEEQVQIKVQQAVEKVIKEKNLTIVLYKPAVVVGGIDITTDVINKME